MGYTTEFEGRFNLNKPLTDGLTAELVAFSKQRHGGNTDHFPGMPGFWCDWAPTEDGRGIEWNGSEKFYSYTAWLQYLIDNFLTPAGYSLTGSVKWRGEGFDDLGTLSVVDGRAVEGPF